MEYANGGEVSFPLFFIRPIIVWIDLDDLFGRWLIAVAGV